MRYFLIAGEASGDLHASNLLKGLLAEDPQGEFRFWGGDLMKEAAGERGELLHHYKDGAVMGLTDVLAKAGKLLSNIDSCKKDIAQWNPDVVILVDYPGFNLKIAEFCHKKEIKTFYYIAPKTWASREGRNAKLKRWIDRMFIVFPFEQDYFKSKGIPFTYVGNPLLDAVDNHNYERPCDRRYIALLPGSRKGEISRMMPVCMEVADSLGCQVMIAGAPARTEADYDRYIGDRKNVKVVFGRTYDILKYADAAIINSGTASLEAALIGTPQVVCWSTSAVSAFVGRHILRVLSHVKYISLGNLIIDRLAFRELIQEDFNVRNVTDEVRRLLSDGPYREKMLADYDEIRKCLGGTGASRRVASEIISALK